MLGVIGGSGFYTFFGPDARSISLDTPYGAPSAAITVGTVGEHEVAFLPRHGVNHEFSPHTVPYRANMWALRALGVRRIFGPCAVGSLTPNWGRAPWWCPISWWTAQRAGRHVLRLGWHPRRLRRPVLPVTAGGGDRTCPASSTAARWW